MRKLILAYYLFFTVAVGAQTKSSVGFNSSYRGINDLENSWAFSGSFSISYKKLYSVFELGGEYWFLDRPINNSWSSLKASTGSAKIALGARQELGNSNFRLSAEVQFKGYFANEITEVYSLYNSIKETDGEFMLASSSRETIQSLPTSPPYPFYELSRNAYYFINKMPYSLGFKLNVGYAIRRFEIRGFISPYWIRFHYENAVDSSNTGEIYWFFYDIGLGVNYMLPNKKNETKQ